MVNRVKRRRTGVLIALGLLAVSVVVIEWMTTGTTTALAWGGGGGP